MSPKIVIPAQARIHSFGKQWITSFPRSAWERKTDALRPTRRRASKDSIPRRAWNEGGKEVQKKRRTRLCTTLFLLSLAKKPSFSSRMIGAKFSKKLGFSVGTI